MPGNINKAGSNPGSAVPVVIVGPVGPILNAQQGEITDWNMESEASSLDTVFILQMSNDGFAANIVEKCRVSMPEADSWTRTFGAKTGNGRLIIPQGYEFRVIAAQGTPGPMSSSIIGQTRKLIPDRSDDAPGEDILDT